MNILFPIETISRELDYKLVLACELAGKNDRRICFGNFTYLDRCLPEFEGGLYIGKNIFRNDSRKYKPKGYYEQKKRGIDSIYYYEEGGFFYNDSSLWPDRLLFSCDPKVFDADDYIFVWGEAQQKILQEVASHPENVKNVGVVRFDLYSRFRFLYEERARKVLADEHDYVLVNTHNGFANHHNSFEKLLNFFNYDKMSAAERIGWLTRREDDSVNLFSLVNLLLFLSNKYPETVFVVRPHPSESIDFYYQVFAKVKNIHVIRSGSVGEWLTRAKVLIHGGCTTSFEGHFMGVPVITYIKVINEHSIYPANSIGYVLDTPESVDQVLGLIMKGTDPKTAGFTYQLKGSNVINNLNEPALDLVMNEYEKIEQKYLKKRIKFKRPSKYFLDKLFLRHYLFQKAYYYFNVLLNRKDKLKSISYIRSKFPGFDEKKIRAFVDTMNKKTGRNVSVKFYNPEYFEIY